MSFEKASALEIGLMLCGYERGFPEQVSRLCQAIDQQAASESPCEKCGGVMCLRAYRRGASYRAVAYCLSCGHADEF